MALPTTEELHPDAAGLDACTLPEVAQVLLKAQQDALAAVEGAHGDIATGAELMAGAIRSGNRLVYAAAGSSGLMALADAAEIEATFGIPAAQIALHVAGGVPQGAHMPGATEDDARTATEAAADLRPGDVVVALSASGSTPYPLAFLEQARGLGVATIAIANNRDAPMFDLADVAILLPTPPEVIAGSTRMGAGTAQKVALNMMSTLMGIALGHVHDGMMVNVRADNSKLRRRAAGIVARISGVPDSHAAACLEATDGAVKPAVLMAAGAKQEDVSSLLAAHDGNLRAALAHL